MTKLLAVIDPDDKNRLTGYEEVANSRWKKKAGRIPVPYACDLDPKRGYRWDDEAEAFVPIKNAIGELPNFSFRAIAEGFITIEEQTDIKFPPSTTKFLDIWRRQIAKED